MNAVLQIPLSLFCSYLLSLHFIVAWYKILDAKRNQFIEQSSLTRQLHNFCGSMGLGCSIFLLWPFNFWSDVWHTRITQFYFISLFWKIFTNLWLSGECLLINVMNISPILILTDLLYGGLNQIMLRFLCFFFWLLIADTEVWFSHPLSFRHFS